MRHFAPSQGSHQTVRFKLATGPFSGRRADIAAGAKPRTQDLRGVPAPMRIVEHGARQRHHVRLAAGHDFFGLFRRQNEADRAHGNPRFPPYPFGKRRIVAQRDWIACFRGDAARRHIDVIKPGLLQCLGKGDCVIGSEAPIHPIVTGDAGAKRHPLWQDGANAVPLRGENACAPSREPPYSSFTPVEIGAKKA